MLRQFAIAAAFSALLFSSEACAFVIEGQTWTTDRTVVMNLSFEAGPFVFSDGFTSLNQSAADALQIWNTYLQHMKFKPVMLSQLPPADNDYDNSASISSTIYGKNFDTGTLAVTLRSYRPSGMTETDVIFNGNKSFDSYRGPLRSGTYDFHRIALHEFGHVLGIDHPDQNHPAVNYVAPNPPPVAIMSSHVSNIDSLEADDIAGGQSLYGAPQPTPTPVPGSAANLINLSTRNYVGINDEALIGGFIVQGSQPITIAVRAIGHSLAAYGITNAISDPTISVQNADTSTSVGYNDDWVDSPDATKIAAIHLDPANSIEPTVLLTLNPGRYTATVRGYDQTVTGIGLVELYDLQKSTSRVGNISTRGKVLSDQNVLIGGFFVGGSQNKQVVVRALGPSLTDAGVTGALSDPTLELVDASGTVVKTNDNWQQGPDAAFLVSSNLAPKYPVESALQTTLSPGSYTAVVRGVGGATGIGLVEVYDLSPAPQ